jgi:DNA transformation protein
MAVSRDFLTFVLEQLAGLPGVTSQRMFGGVGLYCDELFFGLIDDDVLYLRADETNRQDFLARGMGAFRPYADRPQVSMKYYEVPADVLENAAALIAWAARSVGAARAAPPAAST